MWNKCTTRAIYIALCKQSYAANSLSVLRPAAVAYSQRASSPIFKKDPNSGPPEVRVPRSYERELKAKLQKLNEGKSALSAKETSQFPTKKQLLIKCVNTRKDHYVGKTYENWSVDKLASCSWAKASTAGEYFVIKSFGKAPAWRLDNNEEKTTATWQALGIPTTSVLWKLLHERKLERATLIQTLTIPSILRGDNIICVGETGGGKTLAYLLPLMYKLTTETCDSWTGPRLVIVVPTNMLREQIHNAVSIFNKDLNLKSTLLTEESDKEATTKAFKHQLNTTQPDILVLTPTILELLLNSGIINGSSVRYLVCDEADSILSDRAYMKSLNKSLSHIPIHTAPDAKDGGQVILVSSTMPQRTKDLFKDLVISENIHIIRSPFVHRVLPHIQQTFMRTTDAEKGATLLTILKKGGTEASQSTLIFCNKKASSADLSTFLTNNHVPHAVLTGDVSPELRANILNNFISGKVRVIISTDISAHGLDLPNLVCVINYEFPSFLGDYLRRMGRVGRVGHKKQGMVYNLISRKYEVRLVQIIETAVRHDGHLANVGLDYERFLSVVEEKQEMGKHHKYVPPRTDEDSSGHQ